MEEKIDTWDNVDRNRYYGIRKGDTVRVNTLNGGIYGECIVLDYFPGDNNRILIESTEGNPIDWVAEWCDVIHKVEDK